MIARAVFCGIEDGVAVNVASIGATGGVAVIVTISLSIPAEFMHVSVNTVSALIVTVAAVPFVTGPTP